LLLLVAAAAVRVALVVILAAAVRVVIELALEHLVGVLPLNPHLLLL
jgi:hypothetical protein